MPCKIRKVYIGIGNTHNTQATKRLGFVEAQKLEVLNELTEVIRNDVQERGTVSQSIHESVTGVPEYGSSDLCYNATYPSMIPSSMGGAEESDAECRFLNRFVCFVVV